MLNIWRTCRCISVITPLSIRRGVGGEPVEGLCGAVIGRLCFFSILKPHISRSNNSQEQDDDSDVSDCLSRGYTRWMEVEYNRVLACLHIQST